MTDMSGSIDPLRREGVPIRFDRVVKAKAIDGTFAIQSSAERFGDGKTFGKPNETKLKPGKTPLDVDSLGIASNDDQSPSIDFFA